MSNNFLNDLGSFVNSNKLLCMATLGIAVVGYAVGYLCGRVVTWIKECCGTSQKVDKVVTKIFNETPRSPQKSKHDIKLSDKSASTDVPAHLNPLNKILVANIDYTKLSEEEIASVVEEILHELEMGSSQHLIPFVETHVCARENSELKNKALALQFFKRCEQRNLKNEICSIGLDLEDLLFALYATDHSWNTLDPLIRKVAYLSARDVSSEISNDPCHWILTVSNKKEFLFRLMETADELPQSFKENFLRKLAQQQPNSLELHQAFSERNLNFEEYIHPSAWSLGHSILSDMILPHLSFAEIINDISRIDKTTFKTVKGYEQKMVMRLLALGEFREAPFLKNKNVLQREKLRLRYCNYLKNFLDDVNEKPEQISLYVKDAFLQHLIAIDFNDFLMDMCLGSEIVSFIFDHASQEQISKYFLDKIATDYVNAFSNQLTTERAEKLYPLLLQLGKSEETSEALLKVLQAIKYTEIACPRFVKLDITSYLDRILTSLYLDNPESPLWKKFTQPPFKHEHVYIKLETLKLCEQILLKVTDDDPNFARQIQSVLVSFYSFRDSDKHIESTLVNLYNSINESKNELQIKKTQLRIIANGLVKFTSMRLINNIFNNYNIHLEENSTFEYLLNQLIDIHITSGKYSTDFLDLPDQSILRLLLKRINVLPEPVRSSLLVFTGKTWNNHEDYDACKFIFDGLELDNYLNSHKGFGVITKKKYKFLQICSSITTQEDLDAAIQGNLKDKKALQASIYGILLPDDDEKELQALAHGILLHNGVHFKLGLDPELIKRTFDDHNLLPFYEECTNAVELGSLLRI